MKLFRLGLLSGFLLFFPGIEVQAQLDTIHRIPPLHSRADREIQDHYVYLSTQASTPFDVKVTDGSGNPLPGSPFTISDNNPERINIGNGQNPATKLMLPDDSLNMVLQSSGLILSASEPFYANARYRDDLQAASLTAKGREALGTTFRIGVMPIPSDGIRRSFVTSFQATEDNTTVEVSDYNNGVVFNGPINDRSNSLTVKLDKGESYVVSGYSDYNANLRGFIGALLEANKPVVVNSGNWLGSISGPSSAQDAAVDQITPFEEVGKNYAAIEGQGIPEEERPMVVAHQANTEVYVNGSNTPVATLQPGEWHLLQNTHYNGNNHRNMYIRTSKPAYVYQFLAGGSNEATQGMNFLGPLDCGLPKRIDIPSISQIGNTSYNGDIIAITQDGATLKVNGNVQSGANALKGNSNWVTYQISGFNGNVTIESSGAMASGFFGASGIAGYGGLYSGFGVNIEADFTTDDLICKGDAAKIEFTGRSLPSTNFKWAFGDARVVSGGGSGPFKVLFDSIKNYPVQLTLSDQRCQDKVTKNISVLNDTTSPDSTKIKVATVKKTGTNNGHVELSWFPSDSQDLKNYFIERSRNKSNFKLAGKTSDTIFLDTGLNTYREDYYYRIRASDSCGNLSPVSSGTKVHRTIQLSVKNGKNGINLNWNQYEGRPVKAYEIYKEGNLLYTINSDSTFFTDTNIKCDSIYQYRVKGIMKNTTFEAFSNYDSAKFTIKADFKTNNVVCGKDTVKVKFNGHSLTGTRFNWDFGDANVVSGSGKGPYQIKFDTPKQYSIELIINYKGCRDSISKIIGVFFDTSRPEPPTTKIATVKSTGINDGGVKLSWFPSQSVAVKNYLVERSADKNNFRVVAKTTDTSFLDTGLNTYLEDYYYRIRVVDSCGIISKKPARSGIHRTIQLNVEGAKNTITLNWNKYEGRKVQYYQVFRNGDLRFRLPGDSTFMVDSTTICDSFYQYRIKGVMQNPRFESFSNYDSAQYSDNEPPGKVYLKRASVERFNDVVELKWQKSSDVNTKAYQIFRHRLSTGGIKRIAEIQNPDQTSFYDTFNAAVKEVCYEVRVKDHCGNRSTFSNKGCVMQAEGEAMELENRIFWPSYRVWEDGVINYTIFKQIDSNNYKPIGFVDSTTRSFTHEDLEDTTNDYCYYVKATGKNEGEFSNSTRICLKQSPIVHIPNSFTTGNASPGLNDVFRPLGLFIDSYTMRIYNRWGERLFETTNGEPWDGTFQGELVPQGVYVYVIFVEGEDGSKKKYTGTVTVIR